MTLDARLLRVHGDFSEEMGATTECPVGDDVEMDVEPVEVLGAWTTCNFVFACFVFRNQPNFVECISWLGFMFNSTMIENFSINGYDKKCLRNLVYFQGV
jgi:hypothetical protein